MGTFQDFEVGGDSVPRPGQEQASRVPTLNAAPIVGNAVSTPALAEPSVGVGGAIPPTPAPTAHRWNGYLFCTDCGWNITDGPAPPVCDPDRQRCESCHIHPMATFVVFLDGARFGVCSPCASRVTGG